jgi:hypothetical protein
MTGLMEGTMRIRTLMARWIAAVKVAYDPVKDGSKELVWTWM